MCKHASTLGFSINCKPLYFKSDGDTEDKYDDVDFKDDKDVGVVVDDDDNNDGDDDVMIMMMLMLLLMMIKMMMIM